jgi:von Hippel-Lindau disease tumor supressor
MRRDKCLSLATTILALGSVLILAAPTSAEAAGARCREEATAKSRNSGDPINVSFANKTSQPIRAYWLDYQGKRKFYTQIQPGVTVKQETYKGHPWIFTDMQEDCIRIYYPVGYNNELVID